MKSIRIIAVVAAATLVAQLLYVRSMPRDKELPSDEQMRAFLERPEYKRAVEETLARREREELVMEEAAWLGTTGLGEDIERELARYLRREFGEFLDEPRALKASDLEYIGQFDESEGSVHYWRIPHRYEAVFAYVIRTGRRSTMGWGDRVPPSTLVPPSTNDS